MTLTFKDQKELTIPTSGGLSQVQYSDVWIHSEKESRDDAVAAIKAGDGDFLDSSGSARVLPAEVEKVKPKARGVRGESRSWDF